MTLSENSAYLKGLMEGLNLNTEKAEGKMIAAMVDMMENMAYAISDLEEQALAVSDELDEIEDALDNIEDVLNEEADEACGCGHDHDEDEFEYDEDDDLYDVTCPVCDEEIIVDEEMIDEGFVLCPKCGEKLEFDMSDEDDDIVEI